MLLAMKAPVILYLLVLAFPMMALGAADNPPLQYPEHGKVVSVHTLTTVETKRVYTDSQGRTRGGGAYDVKAFAFKIETAERFYEITGDRRGSLQVGDEVAFRVKGKTAFTRSGQKEQRYEITGVELKPQP
jgi:hypothetical protein